MTDQEIVLAALLPQTKREELEKAIAEDEECRTIMTGAREQLLERREEQQLEVMQLEDSRICVKFRNEGTANRFSTKKFKEQFPEDYDRLYTQCCVQVPFRASAKITLKKQAAV